MAQALEKLTAKLLDKHFKEKKGAKPAKKEDSEDEDEEMQSNDK